MRVEWKILLQLLGISINFRSSKVNTTSFEKITIYFINHIICRSQEKVRYVINFTSVYMYIRAYIPPIAIKKEKQERYCGYTTWEMDTLQNQRMISGQTRIHVMMFKKIEKVGMKISSSVLRKYVCHLLFHFA